MSEECPVSITLNILNGKWKLLIIKELLTGKKRFSELKKSMPEVTQKMLTKQLRELEYYGLIEREKYTLKPPPESRIFSYAPWRKFKTCFRCIA
jgi:DNA-binding HxlR family transcriptional regulator